MSFSATSSDLLEVMKTMKLDQSLISFIKERKDEWGMFGKKNSHLYREQLMNMMRDAGLSAEAKLMVYFFFSVIKNQPRVLKAMDAFSQDIKMLVWFSQARDFIATKVTQYVSSAERQKKFPAVNIPPTNPGLDILLWCLMTKDELRTLDNLKDRTTFCQLALNNEMQSLAKEGYQKFWNETVKGSQNPDAVTMNLPTPRMREEFYANPASDRYPLIDISLKPLPPSTKETGYTRLEIITYLESFESARTS